MFAARRLLLPTEISTHKAHMRTFIAIDINEDSKKELADLILNLKKTENNIKWVEPRNIHLTLKFLGNVSDELIEKIKIELKKISKSHKAFEMHLAQAGVFPKLTSPRVLWVGTDEGNEEILKLQSKIEDSMERLGLKKETRPFFTHTTLGRVKELKEKTKLTKKIEKENNFSSQYINHIDKITLYQSKLTPKGPIYSVIEEFAFR
ncbi:MAG: RNA 2',3'-cyclic phosphodiesterase [Candidatus Omnitrophota bacterium]